MDRKILKELKLKRDENLIFSAEKGKAVFFISNSQCDIGLLQYTREVKTNICTDIEGKFIVDRANWESVLEVLNFKDVKQLSIKADEKNHRVYIDGLQTAYTATPTTMDGFGAFATPCVLSATDVKKIKTLRVFCGEYREEFRYPLRMIHFGIEGRAVATDSKRLASVSIDADFCQWAQELTGNKDEFKNGNIPASVFDNFDGKKALFFSQSDDGRFLKVSDGYVTVYRNMKNFLRITYPNYSKLEPDLSAYKHSEIHNLKKFADKKLQPLIKGDDFRVRISSGVAKTMNGFDICEVGDCIDGFIMHGKHLGDASMLLGDNAECHYVPCNKDKIIVFRNTEGSFVYALPMRF